MRTVAIWFGLAALLAAAILLTLTVGPSGLSDTAILVHFRLPRLLLGLVAGSALGLIGAVLQGLLRNPLADPYTLGVASGAALGSGAVLALGVGSSLLLPAGGFIGALVAMAGVFLIARVRGRVTMTGLVLAGVTVSFLFSSLLMLLVVIRGRGLEEAVFLTMGHLNIVFTGRSMTMASILGVMVLVACSWLLASSRLLDIVSLGEEHAMSLGVDVRRLTTVLFLVSSLVVGIVVSFTGAISFVGLIVPHLCRLLLGPAHRRVLPASVMSGATLLLLADVVARSLVPGGLPLSVVTALLGVPFFICLLRSRL